MAFTGGGGGTMFVPSPTHVGHGDVSVSSAVRTLRRSLSRSPSKFNLASSTTPTTTPPSVTAESADLGTEESPQSPSLRYSPAVVPRQEELQYGRARANGTRQELPAATPAPARALSTYTPSTNPPSLFVHGATELLPVSPFATPLRPNVKLSLRSVKSFKPSSSTPSRPPPRPRPSPRSPLKRALSASSDSGNTFSVPSTTASTDKEGEGRKSLAVPTSPLQRRYFDKQSRPHSLHIDVSGASQSMFRALNTPDHVGTPSGALKRSDADMVLDAENVASPVAKRRSLHGISTLTNGSHDSNIFDNVPPPATAFDIHDDSVEHEYQVSASPAPASATSIFRRDGFLSSPATGSGLTRRSSSLRKSTLQQRHGDKGSWGRRTGAQQLAHMTADVSTPVARNNRPRISNDQYVPPPVAANDSPFMGGPQPHGPLPHPSIHSMNPAAQVQAQPHPLSRSVKVSSSGGRFMEDSPMKPPCRPPNPQAPVFEPRQTFASRSIIGGNPYETTSTPQSNQENGRVYMSTGLVSKMHYHPDDDKRPVIPETPSKRPHGIFGTYPPGSHGSGRSARDPGSPVAKFASRGREGLVGTGRGLGLFQRLGGARQPRRGSVLSVDDEVKGQTETCQTNTDVPPTPTKVLFAPSLASSGSNSSLESPTAKRHVPLSAVRPSHGPQEAVDRQPSSSPVLAQGKSPQTPQELHAKSHLSPSHLSFAPTRSEKATPVTPTHPRLVTPVHQRSRHELDAYLMERFSRVEPVGGGEFSTVYKAAYPRQNRISIGPDFGASTQKTPTGNPPPGKAFAIKKLRRPYTGARDRETKLKEVRALTALRFSSHVVHFVASWEVDGHLYVQTEFCDEGSLDKFLFETGHVGRLDDFRIWKILQEVAQGIQEIHHANFIHLDLKPANIFITHEGVLKIGDFGLATEWPAKEGIEAEGDREYIAQEILAGQVDKAADLFSLGLMVLEMSANVALPSNGPSWQSLRKGNFHFVPPLTYSNMADAASITLETALCTVNRPPQGPRGDFGVPKNQPLRHPPPFMCQIDHASSLDQLVAWMSHPVPAHRPTIDQLLQVVGFTWVGGRRRFPATIYEGMFGPDDSVFVDQQAPYRNEEDTVMTGI